MRKRHSFVLPTLLVVVVIGLTGRAPGDEEEKFVVIHAGKVIPVAGEEQSQAQIVLVNGKVRLVGKSLEYPKSAQVINARQEVVMPGMIHPRTRWNLANYSRSGVYADRSASKEVYLDEIDFESLVKEGFTAVCFYPAGSGVPGPGAIYRTAGPQDARDLGAGYLRITMANPGSDKRTLLSAVDKARKELEKVKKARKDWEEKQKKAKEEAAKKATETPKEGEEPKEGDKPKEDPKTAAEPPKETPETKDDAKNEKAESKPDVFTPPTIDPTVLPFAEWIRDKKGTTLLFELGRASDLRHLDDLLKTKAEELPGTLLYLAGRYNPDFHLVIKDLGDRKALVVVEPQIGTLPYTLTQHNLAAELALAGCQVVLLPANDTATGFRQFRSAVAGLVRTGLPRDEALKAVTIYPAKALGIDDRLGTIAQGKEADLIFLDGDPLNPHTRITRVMIHGEIVWEAPHKP